jgi:hypothetical protein
MAKRISKAKPSSSKQMGSKIFGSKSSGKLHVQKYSFENVEGLAPLESYDNIVNLLVLCMVTVVMLVQFRIIKPDASGASLDRSPSFRFYKKKGILADPGFATAAALAAGLPELIIYLPDDPQELEYFLIKALDSYVGNEKFIETPTQGNITECLWGHISRICGFLNSCPAANMSIFGLNATAAEMSISDVIEAIPIKAAQNISPESVATSLRELFSTKDENGNLIPPTFEEAPLSSPVAVSGCSKIEAEIFGDTLPTRRIFKGSGKSSAGSSSGNVSLEDAEQHLDALQLRKYKAALELGKTPLIQKYEAIVLQKTGSVVEKPDSRSRRSRTSPTASQTVDD